MAEIGLLASAAGLVGFAGKITQGCVYLKTLLGKVKDQPAELGALWRELELVSATTEDLDRLWIRLKDSGNTTIDPSASLRSCEEAVSIVTTYIKPFLLVLSNPNSSITSWQRNWQRLKSALQKNTMKDKLENLNRTRQSLVEVQLNMSLALLNHQAQSTRHLSPEQLKEVVTNTSEAAAGVRRTEASIDSLFKHMFAVPTTAIDNLASLQGGLLGHTRGEFAKQVHSQSGLSYVVDKSVREALEAHRQRHNIGEEKNLFPIREPDLPQPIVFQPADQELGKISDYRSYMLRAKNEFGKYVIISTSIYRTPLFQITVQTRRCQTFSGQQRTRNVVAIQLRIDLLRKIIVFTSHRLKYGLGCNLYLRTHNIVDYDAQILKAVKSLDIRAAQKLFKEGFASPFDVDVQGDPLLSICFQSVQNFVLQSKCDSQRFEAFREMITFLIECGSEWSGCVLYLVPDLAKVSEPAIQELLADVVRKIIMHATVNPMDTYGHADHPGTYLDLKASRSPLGQMLLQQDYFMVNWDAQPASAPNQKIYLWENDREILADINGSQLLELLNLTTSLKYAIRQVDTVMSQAYEAIFPQLLKLAAMETGELRTGCLNRVVLLLRYGWNPRQLVSIKNNHAIYGTQFSASEYAVQTKTLPIWKEALKLAGWSDMDIMHLLDEDTYHGLPEMVDGEVTYLTHDECWADFITGLLCGRYLVGATNYHEITALTKSLSCNLKANIFVLYDVIEASKTALSITKIPGSWVADEETVLKPGDNDEFDLQIAKLLYEYKNDWVERYGYGEFIGLPVFLDCVHNSPFVLEYL